MRQETIGQGQKLGPVAGYSLAAAAIWAAAVVLLSVTGLRALVSLLPSGVYWEALGYIVSALLLFVFIALLIKLVPERGVHDAQSVHEAERSTP